METTATIEGSYLVIRVPLETPRLSSSGKTYIVAGTGGFVKTAAVEPQTKKTISVSVNATIPAR